MRFPSFKPITEPLPCDPNIDILEKLLLLIRTESFFLSKLISMNKIADLLYTVLIFEKWLLLIDILIELLLRILKQLNIPFEILEKLLP
jgi:hypothetical protein